MMRGSRASSISRADLGQPSPIGSFSGPSSSMETQSSTTKFSRRVVTTSSTPKRVFRKVGTSSTSAPASIAAMAMSGSSAAEGQASAPVPSTTVTTAPM